MRKVVFLVPRVRPCWRRGRSEGMKGMAHELLPAQTIVGRASRRQRFPSTVVCEIRPAEDKKKEEKENEKIRPKRVYLRHFPFRTSRLREKVVLYLVSWCRLRDKCPVPILFFSIGERIDGHQGCPVFFVLRRTRGQFSK